MAGLGRELEFGHEVAHDVEAVAGAHARDDLGLGVVPVAVGVFDVDPVPLVLAGMEVAAAFFEAGGVAVEVRAGEVEVPPALAEQRVPEAADGGGVVARAAPGAAERAMPKPPRSLDVWWPGAPSKPKQTSGPALLKSRKCSTL